MNRRAALVLALLGALALWAWRAELFTVSQPGTRPRALTLIAADTRRPVALDVTLPQVPVGMRRVTVGGRPLLIHYWAMWEKDGAAQAAGLDSLRQLPGMDAIDVVMVCFDPFPSVARYVGKHRLRLNVLLDGPGEMRTTLKCPSVPYTYCIDRAGRIGIAQAGEVDWLGAATREALQSLIDESAGADTVVATSSAHDLPPALGVAWPLL